MRKSFDQLEREQMGRPMRISIVFHICVCAALVLVIFVSKFFHGAEWGNNAPAGAIQATLVSSAPSIPLPQIVPPNKEVLATETPSQAPAIPEKKTEAVPLPNAVPIQAKPQPKKKVEHQKVPQRVKPKRVEHRANYGERQAANMPHAPQTTQTPAKTVVVNQGGSFASMYGWYVQLIQQKVSNSWFEQEVDPSTPAGTKVTITFEISSGGGVSDIQISQPSGSPTLNNSALRAIQRVGSFPQLPQGYPGRYINVGYTFTYPGSSE
jgi:protein TonB